MRCPTPFCRSQFGSWFFRWLFVRSPRRTRRGMRVLWVFPIHLIQSTWWFVLSGCDRLAFFILDRWRQDPNTEWQDPADQRRQRRAWLLFLGGISLSLLLGLAAWERSQNLVPIYRSRLASAVSTKHWPVADLVNRRLIALEPERQEHRFHAALIAGERHGIAACVQGMHRLASESQGGYRPAHRWLALQLANGAGVWQHYPCRVDERPNRWVHHVQAARDPLKLDPVLDALAETFEIQNVPNDRPISEAELTAGLGSRLMAEEWDSARLYLAKIRNRMPAATFSTASAMVEELATRALLDERESSHAASLWKSLTKAFDYRADRVEAFALLSRALETRGEFLVEQAGEGEQIGDGGDTKSFLNSPGQAVVAGHVAWAAGDRIAAKQAWRGCIRWGAYGASLLNNHAHWSIGGECPDLEKGEALLEATASWRPESEQEQPIAASLIQTHQQLRRLQRSAHSERF